MNDQATKGLIAFSGEIPDHRAETGGTVLPVSATNTPSECAESAAKFGETHTADPVGGLMAGFARPLTTIHRYKKGNTLSNSLYHCRDGDPKVNSNVRL